MMSTTAQAHFFCNKAISGFPSFVQDFIHLVSSKCWKGGSEVHDLTERGFTSLQPFFVKPFLSDLRKSSKKLWKSVAENLTKKGTVQVVLLLDVDFVPPEELSRIFSARQEYQSTLVYLYNNAVIVLPAFETLQGGAEGQQLALKLAKGDSTVPSSILPASG